MLCTPPIPRYYPAHALMCTLERYLVLQKRLGAWVWAMLGRRAASTRTCTNLHLAPTDARRPRLAIGLFTPEAQALERETTFGKFLWVAIGQGARFSITPAHQEVITNPAPGPGARSSTLRAGEGDFHLFDQPLANLLALWGPGKSGVGWCGLAGLAGLAGLKA